MMTITGKVRKSTRKSILLEDKETENRRWVPKFAITTIRETGCNSIYGISQLVTIEMPDDFYAKYWEE